MAFTQDNFEDSQRTKALIDSLILDNANLRIAKNFLKRFQTDPQNGLILKVSDIFISVCDEQIEFNNLERMLLERLYEFQLKDEVINLNKEDFFQAHIKLGVERKESWKRLLEASILVTKVLISNKTDKKGKFSFLGISEREKEKLLFKLDEFYGEEYEGELRSGQSFLEGSVVAIRQTLENQELKPLGN